MCDNRLKNIDVANQKFIAAETMAINFLLYGRQPPKYGAIVTYVYKTR